MKEKKMEKQKKDLVDRLKKEVKSMAIFNIDITRLDFDKLLDVRR
jgi:hypothetical protein